MGGNQGRVNRLLPHQLGVGKQVYPEKERGGLTYVTKGEKIISITAKVNNNPTHNPQQHPQNSPLAFFPKDAQGKSLSLSFALGLTLGGSVSACPSTGNADNRVNLTADGANDTLSLLLQSIVLLE